MGDLEQVERRDAARDELRIDALLDVTREQEALPADLAEKHDRDVVDAGATVCRPLGHPQWVGPEHAEPDLVERESIAG